MEDLKALTECAECTWDYIDRMRMALAAACKERDEVRKELQESKSELHAIMRVTTSGTPLYKRAESAHYYLQQLRHYQKLGVSFDHLRDLLQAELAGQLVVLPCKVGDTVYEIRNNTDACNGCQHYNGIYGSGESWCAQIDDVDLRYYPNIAERPLCEKQFMEVVEHKPEIDWIFTHRNDFGKTVFLTREEAEAALAKEGGTHEDTGGL